MLGTSRERSPRCRFVRSLARLISIPIALAALHTTPLAADPTTRATSWGVWGGGPGQLDAPLGIAIGADGVYVADYHNHRVQKFSRAGDPIAVFGPGGAESDRLAGPAALALAANGDLFVTDVLRDEVRRYAPDGRLLARWGSHGTAEGRFRGPFGVAIARSGEVLVTDLGNHRVQVFTADGGFLRAWGGPGREPGRLFEPCGIAVDRDGTVLVADHGNHRIQRFAVEGRALAVFGGLGAPEPFLLGPVQIAVSESGSLFVTDLANPMVQKFGADGAFVTQLRDEATARAPFGALHGVALAGRSVFVTDATGSRVHVLADESPDRWPSGVPTRFALARLWPNPARGTAQLEFAIPRAGRLRVDLFDLAGRRLGTLADRAVEPGIHRVAWSDAPATSAGVYFVRARLAGGANDALVARVARVR